MQFEWMSHAQRVNHWHVCAIAWRKGSPSLTNYRVRNSDKLTSLFPETCLSKLMIPFYLHKMKMQCSSSWTTKRHEHAVVVHSTFSYQTSQQEKSCNNTRHYLETDFLAETSGWIEDRSDETRSLNDMDPLCIFHQIFVSQLCPLPL